MPVNKDILNILNKEKENNPSLFEHNDGYNTEATEKVDDTQTRIAESLGIFGGVRNIGERNIAPITNKEYQDALAKGVVLNPYRDNTWNEIDENQKKAANQSWGSQLGNSLSQILVNELALGTVKGITDIVGAAIEMFEPAEDRDYNNFASRYFQSLQDKFKEIAPIYRMNPDKAWDMSDFGWWADNFVSVGSTLGLLLPSLGITKGIGALGKLGKAGKVANLTDKTSKVIHYNKLSGLLGNKVADIAKKTSFGNNWLDPIRNASRIQEFGNQLSVATLSRIAENVQESREVYNDARANVLEQLKNMTNEEKDKFKTLNGFEGLDDEQIAQKVSSSAADTAFKNDMGLILFDLAQLRAIGNMWRVAPTKAATGMARAAQRNAIKGLTEGTIKTTGETAAKQTLKRTSKEWFHDAITKYARPLAAESTEALEEAWQGIQQQKGKEQIDNYFRDIDEHKGFMEYLIDPEITVQAFWGWLGGIVFGAGANAFARVGDRIKLGDKKLSDTEREIIKLGANRARVQEINSRINKYNQLISDLKTIDEGHLPTRDKRGDTKDGKRIELSDAQKEYFKQEYSEEFIQDLAINAAEVGNIGLLYEFVTNPQVKEYFKKTAGDNLEEFSEITRKSIDTAVSEYYSALNDIYKSSKLNVHPNIAQAYAKSIVKAKNSGERYNRLLEGLQQEFNDEVDTLTDKDRAWADEYGTKLYLDAGLDKITSLSMTIPQLVRAYEQFVEKIEKGTADLTKDIAYSKIGLNNQINNIKQQAKTLVSTILSNSSFTGDMNQNAELIQTAVLELNDLIDSFNIENAAETANNIAKKAQSINNMYATTTSKFEKNTPKTTLVDIYKEIVDNTIYRDKTLNSIPHNKKEMEEAVNALVTDVQAMLNEYDNKYYRAIKKYISKANNIDEAAAKLLRGETNDKTLNEALEFYNIGAGNTTLATGLVLSLIDEEKEAREKRTNTPATTKTDTGKTSTDTASKINEATSQKNNTASTPAAAETPEQQSGKKSVAEDDSEEELTPEQKKQIEEENKHISEAIDQEDIDIATIENENITEEDRKALYAANAIDNWISNFGDGSHKDITGYLAEAIDSDATGADVQALVNEIAATIKTDESNNNPFKGSTDEEIRSAVAKSIFDNIITKTSLAKLAGKLTDRHIRYFNLSRNLLSKYFYDKETSRFSLIQDSDRLDVLKEVLDEYTKDIIRVGNSKAIIGIKEFLKEMFDSLVDQGATPTEIYTALNKYLELLDIAKNEDYSAAPEIKDNYLISDTDGILANWRNISSDKKFNYVKTLINEFSLNSNLEGATQQSDALRFALSNNFTKLGTKSMQKILATAKSNTFGLKIEKAGKTNVVALYITDKDGKQQNIGILSWVRANKDNTGFEIVNPDTKSTNVFVRFNKQTGEYELDGEASKLYKTIIEGSNSENNDATAKEAFNYLYRTYASKLHTDTKSDDVIPPVTVQDAANFLKNKYIKEFAKIFELDTSILSDIESNRADIRQKAEIISSKLNNIIFYDFYKSSLSSFIHEANYNKISESYSNYAKNVYDNFRMTAQIQNALQQGKPIEISYDNTSNSTLNYEKGVQVPISRLQIKNTIADHPFIIFDESGATDEFGNRHKNPARFTTGTVGILLEDIKNAPMIAIAVGHNMLSQVENTPLAKAYKDAIKSIITEYYNSEASEANYNKLVDRLTSLLGKGSFYKGYSITTNNNSIILSKVTNNEAGLKEYTPVITFYKYNAVASVDEHGNTVFRTKTTDGSQGEIVSSPSVGKYTILDFKGTKTSKPSEKVINSIVDALFENASFSDDIFRNATINKENISRATNNDIVSINFVKSSNRENKFTISIKDVTGKELLPTSSQTYNSFADFIVKNNLYETTHLGRNINQIYNDGILDEKDNPDMNTNIPNAVYAKITIEGAKEGVAANVETFLTRIEKEITKDSPNSRSSKMSTQNILDYAGFEQGEIDKILGLNDFVEKDGYSIIPKNVIANLNRNYDKDTKQEDKTEQNENYAVRNKQGITIYHRGLNAISNNKSELVRLLLHEQLHENISKSGFFTDAEYGEVRINQTVVTFDSALAALQKEHDSGITTNKNLYTLLTNFNSRYGANRDARFVNEWLAEVYSQPTLQKYLNSIDFDGKSVGKNTNKSILQKILDLILSVLNNIGVIRAGSVLEEVRNILGYDGETLFAAEVKDDTATSETVSPGTSPVKEGTISYAINDLTFEFTVPDNLEGQAREDYIAGYKAGLDNAYMDNAPVVNLRNASDEFSDGYDAATNSINNFDDPSMFGLVEDDETEITDPQKGNAPKNTFTTKDEAALDALEAVPDVNPLGYKMVSDMDTYLDGFKPSEMPEIESNLNAGAIKYLCR